MYSIFIAVLVCTLKKKWRQKMKGINSLLIILVLMFILSGCQKPEPPVPSPSPAEPILIGEHNLRRMVERTNTNSKISGGYFLFVGGLEGSTETTVSMKFAWQMNDGTYAISSLPIEKIRIKLNEEITTPTIKFRWKRYQYNGTPEIYELMNGWVSYAVVTVKESDWPIQVNLPLSQ